MPSFVCDHCQETLKKAKLDQHAQRCRLHSFSCIDCYKSFKGIEYRNHFTCITEVQKYETIKTVPIIPIIKDLKINPLLEHLKKEGNGGKISLKKIKMNKKAYSFFKKNATFSLSNDGNVVINI